MPAFLLPAILGGVSSLFGALGKSKERQRADALAAQQARAQFDDEQRQLAKYSYDWGQAQKNRIAKNSILAGIVREKGLESYFPKGFLDEALKEKALPDYIQSAMTNPTYALRGGTSTGGGPRTFTPPPATKGSFWSDFLGPAALGTASAMFQYRSGTPPIPGVDTLRTRSMPQFGPR